MDLARASAVLRLWSTPCVISMPATKPLRVAISSGEISTSKVRWCVTITIAGWVRRQLGLETSEEIPDPTWNFCVIGLQGLTWDLYGKQED